MTKGKFVTGFIKFAAAVILLPLALGLLKSFVLLAASFFPFDRAERWFLSGFAGFFLIFLIKTVPGRIYVFGHELTHAFWAVLFRGKIREFNVSSKNGSVVTTKSNFLISLAPYFFPVYTFLIILIFYVSAFFLPVSKYAEWLFFFVGFSYSFHIFLTAESLFMGQSDVRRTGAVFSYVIIAVLNVIVAAVMLKFVSPDKISLKKYFFESWTVALKISEFARKYLTELYNLI